MHHAVHLRQRVWSRYEQSATPNQRCPRVHFLQPKPTRLTDHKQNSDLTNTHDDAQVEFSKYNITILRVVKFMFKNVNSSGHMACTRRVVCIVNNKIKTCLKINFYNFRPDPRTSIHLIPCKETLATLCDWHYCTAGYFSRCCNCFARRYIEDVVVIVIWNLWSVWQQQSWVTSNRIF